MLKKLFFIGVAVFTFTACHTKPSSNALDNERVNAELPTGTQENRTSDTTQTTDEVPLMIAQTLLPPKIEDTPKRDVIAVIKTNKGDITIGLLPEKAPLAVINFINLARQNFYDGVKFHRIMKNFMIQTGDPNSKDEDWSDDGMGGPGYGFADEAKRGDIPSVGDVAMANTGLPNSNGSQFFIMTASSAPWLDGKHAIFGKVLDGMEVVRALEATQTGERDHPLQDIGIETVEIIETESKPPK